MSETGEPFLNLSRYSLDEKEQLTTESMERGEPLIYGGHISADGLLGEHVSKSDERGDQEQRRETKGAHVGKSPKRMLAPVESAPVG